MIDYNLIAKSIDFYEGVGFKRVEAPWLITEAINRITCPNSAKSYHVLKDGQRPKTFVASGEQSFLYQINKGFLPEGKYQTVTPCMRDDAFDIWHTKYFIKNELIHFGNIQKADLYKLMMNAFDFYASFCDKNKLIVIELGEDAFDINYKDIEIGSYGIRQCEFTKWVYGTGLAEPRFSRLLSMEK
jgi:hypothetical protein